MPVMAVFLAVACIFDTLYHKIPNVLTGMMLTASAIYVCLTAGAAHLPIAFIRMFVTGALFYPFFMIGTLGAGDVKLLAVCSAYIPVNRVLPFIFLAMVIASAAGVLRLMIRKEFVQRIGRLVMYIEKIFKTGKVERYHISREAAVKSGIALAGPLFVSALIGIGGLY